MIFTKTRNKLISIVGIIFLSAIVLISCTKDSVTPTTPPYNFNYSVSWAGYKFLLYSVVDRDVPNCLTLQLNDTIFFISDHQFIYKDSTCNYSVNNSHYGASLYIMPNFYFGSTNFGPVDTYIPIGGILRFYTIKNGRQYHLSMRRFQ